MATKKKNAEKQPTEKEKKAKEKASLKNPPKSVKKKKRKKKKLIPPTTTIQTDENKSEASVTSTEEIIVVDPALQSENNVNATAPAPTPPKQITHTHTQPNSLAVEVEKFGMQVESIIKDHVDRLPMSKADAVQFIKRSNIKCRVEIADVNAIPNTETGKLDVVENEVAGKTVKKQVITVYLGNEKYVFSPLTLH